MNPLKRLWAWLHGNTKARHPHQDGDQQLSYRQEGRPNAATWPDATREASGPRRQATSRDNGDVLAISRRWSPENSAGPPMRRPKSTVTFCEARTARCRR